MTVGGSHKPEIIESDRILRRGSVADVEAIKVKWSIVIAVAALLIATGTLAAAVLNDKPELIAWATGLISAIAGSALTYGFNKSGS